MTGFGRSTNVALAPLALVYTIRIFPSLVALPLAPQDPRRGLTCFTQPPDMIRTRTLKPEEPPRFSTVFLVPCTTVHDDTVAKTNLPPFLDTERLFETMKKGIFLGPNLFREVESRSFLYFSHVLPSRCMISPKAGVSKVRRIAFSPTVSTMRVLSLVGDVPPPFFCPLFLDTLA